MVETREQLRMKQRNSPKKSPVGLKLIKQMLNEGQFMNVSLDCIEEAASEKSKSSKPNSSNPSSSKKEGSSLSGGNDDRIEKEIDNLNGHIDEEGMP